MILAKLKEATKIQHQQLEMTVDIMNNALNLNDYEKLLRKFYGFYASVEPQIFSNINLRQISFNYEERLKLPLLERDLQILNGADFEVKTLEICGDTPNLSRFAQVIGCMYVLEGATLGGQIIGRHLREKLNLSPANGAAFFNSYGERVGQMWKSFVIMAADQALILDKDEEITMSAQETFIKFEKWFR